MNTTILRKCIEELSKDKPDISYLRGALETLVELSNPTPMGIVPPILASTGSTQTYKPTNTTDDEETELSIRYAGGPIGGLQ